MPAKKSSDVAATASEVSELREAARVALERIRAEYLEMPGLKLKIEQVQRLWGIEQSMCTEVLDSLVKAKFLCLKADGTYVRLTEGSIPLPRPVKAALTSTLRDAFAPRELI